MLGTIVLTVRHEVALTHKLVGLFRIPRKTLEEVGLGLRPLDDLEGIRIDLELASRQELSRILFAEKFAVEAQLRGNGRLLVDPVNRAANFPAIGRLAAAGLWIVFSKDSELAVDLLIARAADDIGPAETDLQADEEAVLLLRRIDHEVIALDPEPF